MALLSLIRILLLRHQQRAQARKNLQSVAHLSDSQLRDVGMWRTDGRVGMYDPSQTHKHPPTNVQVKAIETMLESTANTSSTGNEPLISKTNKPSTEA
jgi:uncharacterized protein YjiS (DUF1127 family)